MAKNKFPNLSVQHWYRMILLKRPPPPIDSGSVRITISRSSRVPPTKTFLILIDSMENESSSLFSFIQYLHLVTSKKNYKFSWMSRPDVTCNAAVIQILNWYSRSVFLFNSVHGILLYLTICMSSNIALVLKLKLIILNLAYYKCAINQV